MKSCSVTQFGLRGIAKRMLLLFSKFNICSLKTQYPHPISTEPRINDIVYSCITKQSRSGGLLSQFPPFHYFPNFSSLSKHTLTVKYRIYIWQLSPQLSCGDTCQIWMWFEESNMYFCETENFAYGEINERSFSNPHPRPVHSSKHTCDCSSICGIYNQQNGYLCDKNIILSLSQEPTALTFW